MTTANTTATLIAELRRLDPTAERIEAVVDWNRRRGLVGALDTRSRLNRALDEDPAGWTDGVAADVRKAIRDFVECHTGRRPR